MNTNRHEYPWTCLAATPSWDEGRERGRPARTTLAQPYPALPSGSTGNGATIPLQPSPGRSCRQGGRAPHHGETERPPNPEDAARRPYGETGHPTRRGASLPWVLVDSSFFFCFSQAVPPPCRADHTRAKHSIVNKGEPRMNTNRHKYQWTCMGFPAAGWLRRRHGRKASPKGLGGSLLFLLFQPRETDELMALLVTSVKTLKHRIRK